MTKVNSNLSRAGKQNGSYKHGGKSEHPRLYSIWKDMRKRCNNPNHCRYHRYGGRGVSVCPDWGDFAVFRDWALANGYTDDLTIERDKNSLDYCPSNCTWIPLADQALNHDIGANNTSGYVGVSKKGNRYRAYISYRNEWKHIGAYKTIQEAVQARNDYIVANGLPHKLQ